MPRKNMNLPYSVPMYWTHFWQPTVHVQQISDQYLYFWGSGRTVKFTTVIEAKIGILELLVYFWPIAFLSTHEDIHGLCRYFPLLFTFKVAQNIAKIWHWIIGQKSDFFQWTKEVRISFLNSLKRSPNCLQEKGGIHCFV